MAEPEFPPAIVLAAGEGRRAGGPKGLFMLRGRPWLEVQLEALARARVGRVVVVLGAALDAHLAAMPWLAGARLGPWTGGAPSVRVTESVALEEGPFGSLRAAAALLGEDDARAAAFVLPVDVPVPRAAVWRTLALALTGDALAAVPTFAGRGGHPVLLHGQALAALRAVRRGAPEARLDRQLRALGARARRVEVDDPAVCVDLDTAADFAAHLALVSLACINHPPT